MSDKYSWDHVLTAPCSVVTDPADPKFDLEKLLLKVSDQKA